MPFNDQIKFDRFADNFDDEVTNRHGEEEEEVDTGHAGIFKEFHDQRQSYNDTVVVSSSSSAITTGVPVDRHRQQTSHFQFFTSGNANNNKSVTCKFTLCLLLAVLCVFAVVLAFVLVVAFIVKCDESKLINHYEERKTSMESAYSDLTDIWKRQEMEIESGYKAQKIVWRLFNTLDRNAVEKTEPAGVEQFGGNNLLMYVARTTYRNGTVVGKYCPYFRKMFYGYLGKELDTKDFEILSYPPGSLSWLPRRKGDALNDKDTLVFGGNAPDNGDDTFICRIKHEAHLVVGKYLAKTGECLGAYRHEEFSKDTFEILAINEMARTLATNI